jgi:hypothetical protein
MEALEEEVGSSRPLVVYTIVARERDGRKFWVRIGTAFRNRDGSLNAVLDAVPTNGTLHIRAMRPLGEREREGTSGVAFPADAAE